MRGLLKIIHITEQLELICKYEYFCSIFIVKLDLSCILLHSIAQQVFIFCPFFAGRKRDNFLWPMQVIRPKAFYWKVSCNKISTRDVDLPLST